uniref:Uncharacterized protein n=1 Tax=Nephroselmis olivacea TaxID=31312 RepID=Q9TKU6_NEPOL|nr:hypothetical protein NeolCp125 [Nephroselmis olivacea]AAD54901.1 unknown [Nephroselmis olivacea]
MDTYLEPSNYRYDPRYKLIMPGLDFKTRPAEPYGFEFEQTIREQVKKRAEQLKQIEEAKEASKKEAENKEEVKKVGKKSRAKDMNGVSTEQEPIPSYEDVLPQLTPRLMKIKKRQLAREYQLDELTREFERSRKSLVSERDTREYLSPKTWFKKHQPITAPKVVTLTIPKEKPLSSSGDLSRPIGVEVEIPDANSDDEEFSNDYPQLKKSSDEESSDEESSDEESSDEESSDEDSDDD